MRGVLRFLALLPLVWLLTPVGRVMAQACHMVMAPARTTDPSSSGSLRAGLTGTFASYRNAFGEGEYQGLSPALQYQHAWGYAGVAVPGYRLVRNGEARIDVGDVAVMGGGALYRDVETGFALGLGMEVTFPSGNEKFGFGMGHVMVMPGLWLAVVRELFSLRLDANYGRALGAHAGHHGGHHHGPLAGSIVQPMNASEIEHALSATVTVHPHMRLLGRLFGAVPVADANGQAREMIALGGQGTLGIWDLTLEVQLPVVGSPFTSRTILALGAEW